MVKNLIELIDKEETRFTEIAKTHLKVRFTEEAYYAKEAISNSKQLQDASKQNPQSLQSAILNVAKCGVSLSPIKKEAYLIPRYLYGKNTVCLEVSYRGLVNLAIDSGGIKHVSPVLVYSTDIFDYHGPHAPPTHKFNPFSKERGELIGVYCIAVTRENDNLVDFMSIEEVNYIRDRSKAKNGPWKDFYTEMVKKTMIRRASKLWPSLPSRFENAISVLNEHDGIDFEKDKQQEEQEKEEAFIMLIEEKQKKKDEILKQLGILTKDLDKLGKIEFMFDQLQINSVDELLRWKIDKLDQQIEFFNKMIKENKENGK